MKYDHIRKTLAEAKILSAHTDSHGNVTAKTYGDDEFHKPQKANGIKPGSDKAGVSKARELARRAIANMVKEDFGVELTEEQMEQLDELHAATVQSYFDKNLKGMSKRVDQVGNPNNVKSVNKVNSVPKVPGLFGPKTNRNAVDIAKTKELDIWSKGMDRAKARGAAPWPELKGVPRDETIAKKIAGK